jgi:predicted DNA-binding transcriptional regulator YafY
MNLQRILIINRCLRDTKRKWTLQDLIDACKSTESNSRRSVQADIELMRNKERGYAAPIVVTDKKYYSYADDKYSLIKQNLTEQDKDNVTKAIELIGSYCAFGQMAGVQSALTQLHERVAMALGIPMPEKQENNTLFSEVQQIKLWVEADMAEDIMKNKLHESQCVEQEEIDGSINIRLSMPFTAELENFLIENNSTVKVTAPMALQSRIKKKLSNQ